MQHGIHEELPSGGDEFADSKLTLHPLVGGGGTHNAFAAFHEALTSTTVAKTTITVPMLFNQILVGHRLFTTLTEEDERFVEISSIPFLKDSFKKEIWAQIRVPRNSLSRLGYANQALLTVPNMRPIWRLRQQEDDQVVYELSRPVSYTGRPSDVVRAVAAKVMPFVWASVSTAAPYRRYYLYKATGISPILPQMASIYAGFYYLGSLTRYRPANFRALVDDRKIGPSIVEFLQNQPMQFLYLLASQFAEQEITRAAIV